MIKAVIRTRYWTKKLEDLLVVDDINLGRKEGKFSGLLEPNEAGKTSRQDDGRHITKLIV